MSVFVKKPGILSTIQDLGRSGFQKSGINTNGAMDRQTVRLINVLLGNVESEAVLEMHFPAPLLEFTKDARIALGGGEFTATIDSTPVDNRRPIDVAKGQHLRFLNRKAGNRSYLAVRGGFEIDSWLGSASTNLLAKYGGFRGRALETGDVIHLKRGFSNDQASSPYLISDSMFDLPNGRTNQIRVIPGAEFRQLTALSEEAFLQNDFEISANSNRMGFRLSGEPLRTFDHAEMLSSAVDFGTIQLLPDGQMIILMADHQTTGGYPRIAHVISRDHSVLAQSGVKDRIRFELVTISEAESLVLENRIALNYLKFALEQKTKG